MGLWIPIGEIHTRTHITKIHTGTHKHTQTHTHTRQRMWNLETKKLSLELTRCQKSHLQPHQRTRYPTPSSMRPHMRYEDKHVAV
jgi:hypothetical protein